MLPSVLIYMVDQSGVIVPVRKTEDGGVSITDSPHGHIHDEKTITFVDEFTGLGIGASKDYLIKASAENEYHFLLKDFDIESAGIVRLFKNPTVSANGTEIAGNNRVVGATYVHTTKCYHTPTITDNGTFLEGRIFYTGKNIEKYVRETNEVIIKKSQSLLVEVLSNAAGNEGNIVFSGYEP